MYLKTIKLCPITRTNKTCNYMANGDQIYLEGTNECLNIFVFYELNTNLSRNKNLFLQIINCTVYLHRRKKSTNTLYISYFCLVGLNILEKFKHYFIHTLILQQKNPAYGRHCISRRVRIVASIPKNLKYLGINK